MNHMQRDMLAGIAGSRVTAENKGDVVFILNSPLKI